MSRRRSTVHDAAALRLHPNGVRVPLPNDTVKNPTSSVVVAKSQKPTQDARGNWVATDAGGDGRITKRRRVSGAPAMDNGEGEEPMEVEIPVKVYKDSRANRRVAFETDFTFLAEPTPPHGSGSKLPQPSSDFLKCIHHFASQHYASSGQLFDSAAQYRKEKKEKRRLRLLRAETSNADAEEGTDDHNEESDEEQPSNAKSKGKGKAKFKSVKQSVTQRDMYKAFDGSALMCIGMLLQSHISSKLQDPERCKPEGWEDVSSQSDEPPTNLDNISRRRTDSESFGDVGGGNIGSSTESSLT